MEYNFNDIKITDQFPGGNIIVDKVEGNNVYLRQDLRDTKPWWHYWNFKITISRPQKLFFHFQDDVIGYFGPAINEGDGWHYNKNSFISHKSFVYDFVYAGVYQFAFSLPYQVEDFERFFNTIAPYAQKHFAVKTKRGRDQFYISAGNTQSDKAILFTCRHHACESVAEFVLEGLLEHLLTAPNPIKQDCAIYCVPFVDLDGVEDGDQGKDRAPHDHNRDYIDEPIYPTVRFIQDFVRSKNLFYGIDLHCPAKYHGIHDYMSLVQNEAPYDAAQELFSQYLENQVKKDKCSIQYSQKDNIVHGIGWNIGAPRTFSRFCCESGARLAFSFEIPFFGRREQPYMPQELREFGKSFAKALIGFYLDTNK
ncbi:MAG TPA: hypothetical protein VIL24_05690 [Clostridia bacterium]